MDKVKSILMSHGEKIVAAVCALFGFLALTSANWQGNNQSPKEIEQTVTDKKSTIEQNAWPEEDQKEFDNIDDVLEITSDENQLLTQASDFPLIDFSKSPNRLKEKNTQPTILAPIDPVADSIVVAVAMPPSEKEPEEGEVEDEDGKESEGDTKEEDEASEAEELLRRKFGLRAGGGGIGSDMEGMGTEMGSGGLSGGLSSGGLSSGGRGGGGAPRGVGGLGGGPPSSGGGGRGMTGMGGGAMGNMGMGMGEDEEEYGEDLYGSYGEGLTSKTKDVRVNAGVSVRMVVDIQKQRNEFRRALHLVGGYQVAQQYIQYVDLQVERKQKQEGPDPWGAEWEPVSSEDLGEILKESFGVDRDIVSPAVTRNTITMPLPRRAAGVWLAEEASHPRVEKFELSPEEKALIDKLNQLRTEQLEKALEEKPKEVELGGFSSFAQSAVDMSSSMGSMYGGEDEYDDEDDMDSMYQMYEQSGNEALSDEQKEQIDAKLATADNRLLLVRFMDFTVERGYSYQYRVRLEMKNPNYRHPLDELEDPAIGAEPTLISDWSLPTPEVFVNVGHRLYLTGVDARRGTQEKVDISVYTDTTETGMPVMGDVKVLMGMPIAGRKNLEVVDLTSDVLESREITIGTEDLLSSAEAFSRLSTSDHPELKRYLSALPRGMSPIADEICIVDSTGQTHLRSVGDRSRNEKQDRAEVAGILKLYEVWRPVEANSNEFFGGEGGEDDYDDEDSGLGMSQGSSSSGNWYGGGSSRGGRSSGRGSSGGRGRGMGGDF